MPGMRLLARLHCPQCARPYFGDLPAGHGLVFPCLLDPASGEVWGTEGGDFFRTWLAESYAARQHTPVAIEEEVFAPVREAVLLNCLDGLYGHGLLKLLNAQYHIDHPAGGDLVVLVPRHLRWLVPAGVGAIWTVDLPLRAGTQWNDWLAGELQRRVAALGACRLSLAIPHPDPADYRIERFTRVTPFDWAAQRQPPAIPVITFIWREDRLWASGRYGVRSAASAGLRSSKRLRDQALPAVSRPRLARRLVLAVEGLARRALRTTRRAQLIDAPGPMIGRVVELAEHLGREFGGIDFAVAGVGTHGSFPKWVRDLRVERVDPATEVRWCERYASSHVVIGVHGSNMLLPTAHAGAVVELVPADRWENVVQDIGASWPSGRDALARCRFVPDNASPRLVGQITGALLRSAPHARVLLTKPWTDHEAVSRDPFTVAEQLGRTPVAHPARQQERPVTPEAS